ncbi:MAG: transaldolase [Chloroflexota bacterium]|nr:transaldolase [Dehalococcoidia bacterium]MDW8252833.1 transaldolase [Chloroflexota bacterium]
MNRTQQLRYAGQTIWLDFITRRLVRSGTLKRYIEELHVTGLTSNPTIFDNALRATPDYDEAIRQRLDAGLSDEELFLELAIEDVAAAADLFRLIHNRTAGVDGWVSLEVSPLLAYDTESTLAAAKQLFARVGRPNVLIKIPGTAAGLPAIEEAIFAGIPVNVTLLFSPEQYQAAADAYLRGLERRQEAGLNLAVGSVASVFVSRWDRAVMGSVPADLAGQLGIAIAKKTYRAYRDLLNSERWKALARRGARAQRLLWASTSTKDPSLPDTWYVSALVAPNTINTMPEETLLAFADHGEVGALLSPEGADDLLARFTAAGVDIAVLADRLQQDGTAAFVASWNDVTSRVAAKRAEFAAHR